MAAYRMAAVKVIPPNDFPLSVIRSHMVFIHLFLMLCDLQRVVRDLRPSLYFVSYNIFSDEDYVVWVPCSLKLPPYTVYVEQYIC
jgi:hypothetical protein